MNINEVITVGEAATIWSMSADTIKSRLQRSPEALILGVDYRKAPKAWLITKEAMIKLYGEPKINE